MVSEMVTEYNNGQMVLDMKDNGEIIGLMEKESLHILMGTYTKEIGLMIRLTDMEFIII